MTNDEELPSANHSGGSTTGASIYSFPEGSSGETIGSTGAGPEIEPRTGYDSPVGSQSGGGGDGTFERRLTSIETRLDHVADELGGVRKLLIRIAFGALAVFFGSLAWQDSKFNRIDDRAFSAINDKVTVEARSNKLGQEVLDLQTQVEANRKNISGLDARQKTDSETGSR